MKSSLPSSTLLLPHILPSSCRLDPRGLLPHMHFSTQLPRHWQMWTKEDFCTMLIYLNRSFPPFSLFSMAPYAFFFYPLLLLCLVFAHFSIHLSPADPIKPSRENWMSLSPIHYTVSHFLVLYRLKHILQSFSYILKYTFLPPSLETCWLQPPILLQSEVSPVLL